MALAIYRKYRPQTFSEIIGQEHVVQTLTNAILTGIISHAYLFSGPRGSGKTTIARLLAKSFNCSGRKEKEFEPCNNCSSCLEIAEGRSLDMIEIDAASNRRIDEMRELIEGVKYAPTKSKYKVFIIDESHQLTKEAANALLKTLEEPPAHAIFILATTELHKMIPTIVSRCQRFDFKKLTVSEIVKRLEILCKNEKSKIEKPALELIALNSGGSIRDSESLLGQVLDYSGRSEKNEIKAEDIKNLLGIIETDSVIKFCGFLTEKNASGAVTFLNEIGDRGLDMQEFAKAVVNYLRQGLVLKITGQEGVELVASGLTKEELERLKKQIAILSLDDLKRFLTLFNEAENQMKYASIIQLPLEMAVVEAIGLKE